MATRIPRKILVSAVSVPVLVVGQFAMMAVVPVAVVAVATVRHVRDRSVRGLAALLTAAYATPLVLWAIGPDRAPSLTKDMSPVLAVVIVAVAVALAVRIVVLERAADSRVTLNSSASRR